MRYADGNVIIASSPGKKANVRRVNIILTLKRLKTLQNANTLALE